MQKEERKKLTAWFEAAQRELPWRQDRTPYSIWVSEMMLQQTQVAVVIPYFLRWMERFPTVADLAAADLDEVIKLWEGLGYYSRARYLHEGAQYIVTHFQGKFPENPEELIKIKGFGKYTLGAVCSLAFQQKIPAVDGNVMRVLSRYYCIEEEIKKSSTQKKIWDLAYQILPDKDPGLVNEALIELGATLCTKTPKCIQCPIKDNCIARQQGKAAALPLKTVKINYQQLYRAVGVIHFKDSYIIRREQPGEIMSGLHQFPYIELKEDRFSEDDLLRDFENEMGCSLEISSRMPSVKHSFTRFRATLYPIVFEAKVKVSLKAPYQWIAKEQMGNLAFSSGHRSILQQELERE